MKEVTFKGFWMALVYFLRHYYCGTLLGISLLISSWALDLGDCGVLKL